jgi:two-component system cell cycle response regulator DivK
MLKILVIEDNEDNREILRHQLGRLGYEVVEATDGLQGLKRAQEENPDMMIVDIMLPGGIDGREVVRKLRADSKTKETPILAVTVLFQKDEVQSCLDAGCNDVLSRPITLPQLKEKLDKLSHLVAQQK